MLMGFINKVFTQSQYLVNFTNKCETSNIRFYNKKLLSTQRLVLSTIGV